MGDVRDFLFGKGGRECHGGSHASPSRSSGTDSMKAKTYRDHLNTILKIQFLPRRKHTACPLQLPTS
jgi:hypothetical protein